MSNSRPRPKLPAPVAKPVTPETFFHIDYDWWERSKLDLKTYVYSRLELGQQLPQTSDDDEVQVDLVDRQTGEVRRVDGFQYVLQTHFSQLPDNFAETTSFVDAVFCILLANGNKPMTANEIAERVKRPTDTVLKTLGGSRVYQGIRPIYD